MSKQGLNGHEKFRNLIMISKVNGSNILVCILCPKVSASISNCSKTIGLSGTDVKTFIFCVATTLFM